MKNQTTTCPQCPNHCPSDALHCDRGRAFFASEKDPGTATTELGHHGPSDHAPHSTPGKNTLEGLLRICGHTLHHQEISGNLFQALSAEEQDQLKALLAKLVDSWEH